MKKNIDEIIEKYSKNQDLRKFTNKYYSDYIYTEEAKSKEDMNKMTMGIYATLNYYLEQESLSDGDIEVMERRVAEYELAVSKILDYRSKNNDYDANDLERLIENISEYYEKLSLVDKKKRTVDSKIGYNF